MNTKDTQLLSENYQKVLKENNERPNDMQMMHKVPNFRRALGKIPPPVDKSNISQDEGRYVKYEDYKQLQDELAAAVEAFHRVEAIASKLMYGNKAAKKVF